MFSKVFGTKELRRKGDDLVVREDPRSLPKRIAGGVAIVGLIVLADYFVWIASIAPGALGGVFQFIGLVLAFAGVVASYALIQLIVFVQFPITINRELKTVARGNKILLEGKFKGNLKSLVSKRAKPSFHVTVAPKKGSPVFLWRTDSESEGQKMVDYINGFLSKSLSDAEIGENALDHVG